MFAIARQEKPDEALYVFNAVGDSVAIGRDKTQCGIVLDGQAAGVSRFHAVFTCRSNREGKPQLFSMDHSTYGITWNDRHSVPGLESTERPVNVGERFLIGDGHCFVVTVPITSVDEATAPPLLRLTPDTNSFDSGQMPSNPNIGVNRDRRAMEVTAEPEIVIVQPQEIPLDIPTNSNKRPAIDSLPKMIVAKKRATDFLGGDQCSRPEEDFIMDFPFLAPNIFELTQPAVNTRSVTSSVTRNTKTRQASECYERGGLCDPERDLETIHASNLKEVVKSLADFSSQIPLPKPLCNSTQIPEVVVNSPTTSHYHRTVLERLDSTTANVVIMKVTPGIGANKRSRENMERTEILDVTPFSIPSQPSTIRMTAKQMNRRVSNAVRPALNQTVTKGTEKNSDWLQPKKKQQKRNDYAEEEDEEEGSEKAVNSSSTDFFEEHASQIRQMNPQNEDARNQNWVDFTADSSETVNGNWTQFNASLIAEKLEKAISFMPLVRSIVSPITSGVQQKNNANYPNVKKFRKAPQGCHMYNKQQLHPGSLSISQSIYVFPILREATPPRH